MSSHHIVRENQEPALIIASLDELDREYLGQLLEWSPSVFADDYSLDFLLAERIKVDFLITEKALSPTVLQEQISLISLLNGLIPDALAYLIAHNYKAVNLLCREIPADIATYAGAINIVLFLDGLRYVFVQDCYEKWKRAGDKVFVAEELLKSLQGIRKIAPNSFEVETDGFINLQFNTADFVLIGEDI